MASDTIMYIVNIDIFHITERDPIRKKHEEENYYGVSHFYGLGNPMTHHIDTSSPT